MPVQAVTEDPPSSQVKPPEFLELEVTGLCNLACGHCYADSSPRGTHGTMTEADWERVIDEATEAGVTGVQFIGGEPSLLPALPRLVRRALAAGLRVSVFSNLTRVTPALWELFSLPGVSLATSWYSGDPAVHARVTGSGTAWGRTRANIAEAVRRGISVHASVVGVLDGQDTMAAAEDLRALGVAAVRVRPVQAAGRAGAPGAAAELCGRCGDGQAAVLPDGTVAPCVIGRQLSAGSVHDAPLAELLAGPAWEALVAAIPRGDADCPPIGGDGECPPKWLQPPPPPPPRSPGSNALRAPAGTPR